MNDGTDTARFVSDPSLLIELCREVVDRLDVDPGETDLAAQEAQLQAIARAVAQLERAEVPVPDTLRAEKTRLSASVQGQASARQALSQLADELQGIVRDLRDRLGQSATTPKVGTRNPRGRRQRLPMTPRSELREYILSALRTLGGSADIATVIGEVGRLLEGKLLEGDKVWRPGTNEPAWSHNAKWERYRMREEGVLRRDSPRGVWELGEGQQ